MKPPNPRGTYLAIAESLSQRIKEGQLVDSLPSEAKLMQEYSASRNTIRRALNELRLRSLLESVPGTGWRVAQSGRVKPLIDRLVELLRDQPFTVGDTYPSESSLCAKFEVSRTAVRRALAQMEGIGLLEAVHGKGRIVRALPTPHEQP